MNVAAPYTVLCPGLEGPTLEVLARTSSSMTGRQVARLARHGSQRGILTALNRLADQGLVGVRRVGNSSLYSLNRDHVAFPAVEQVLGLRLALFDRIRDLLEKWDPPLVHASVFGSAACADGDVESDIDLLLVRPHETSEEDPAWRARVDDLAERVRAWSGNHASIIELSPDRLSEVLASRRPIAGELRRDAVTLAGPPIAQIAAPRTRGRSR